MRTKFESEHEDADGILERAVVALREAPFPPGPSPEVRAATLAALSRGVTPRTSYFPPRFGAPHMLARAAVLAGLAAGAAAAYFAVVRHTHNYAREQSVRPSTTPTLETAKPQSVASAGSMVTGEIRFEGQAPPPQLVDFGANAGCSERHGEPAYDDSLLVNLDDTLQNVVVSVVAGLPDAKTYPAPAGPVVLNQVRCTFQPHVLAMQTGQPILVRNSDPVLHNAHSLSVRNKRFNIVQPLRDAVNEVPSPREPEIFRVTCDIHPWMNSWFCAFNHPYFAVSGANGTFTLRGLPPGRYRLRAWHERLGTREYEMVVKPGRDATINFIFRLPPAGGVMG